MGEKLVLRGIPFSDMKVGIFYSGAMAQVRDGQTHSKICRHAIFARATTGRYEISCGDGRHADLAAGEAFLTGANLPLRIVHHGDPDGGRQMSAHWLHMRYTLFGTLDITSLVDLPLRVSAGDCEPFSAVITELQSMDQDTADDLRQVVRRQELASRFACFAIWTRCGPMPTCSCISMIAWR